MKSFAYAVPFLSLVGLLAHCSSATTDAVVEPAGGDGGGDSTSPTDDGGVMMQDAAVTDSGTDAPVGPVQHETEPNNGAVTDASATPQTNAMTIPGSMLGAIDPADDIDIFTVPLAAGELWSWQIVSDGSSYVPHLTIFDTSAASLNPTVLVTAANASEAAHLDHFVLGAGSFVAAVRDARNVPAGTSQHVGGPTVTYRLVASKVAPAPTTVTFPSTVTGSLKYVSNVALYSFVGTAGMKVKIVVNAQRKLPASALDSRLSLFNETAKTNVLTNDDASGTTTDSEITGPLPAAGTYYVILENEAAMSYAAGSIPDLSYAIDFSIVP